ncbi:hypothetical protein [Mesorhizobium sp. M0040]|uniref:hypothetical protein n=1 Tax=Mesorhizobium sp. M0040 TaxID=2956855 RepID=UPI00333B6806
MTTRIAFFVGVLALAWSPAAVAQQTFGGNDCIEDCSGHKAGYDWAQQNQITDEDDCSSNSQSFNEGCHTYLEDPNRGSDDTLPCRAPH